MKRVLALVQVGIILLATLAAAVGVSDPSPRHPIPSTRAETPLRLRSGGARLTALDATGPHVAYTLVLSTNTLIPGNFPGDFADPEAAAYDSARGEVFVTNLVSNNVSVISDSTDSVMASISVPGGPIGVVYDSEKGEIFVANVYNNTVSVISDVTNAIVATIGMGDASGSLAYGNGRGEVFISHLTGGVSVISDSTDLVTAYISAGNRTSGVAYDSDTGKVYASNSKEGTISIISLGPSIPAPVGTGGNELLWIGIGVLVGAAASAAIAMVILFIRRKRPPKLTSRLTPPPAATPPTSGPPTGPPPSSP